MAKRKENEIWEAKDLRMVRMNALNRAVELYLASTERPAEWSKINMESIFAKAEEMVNWVYGKKSKKGTISKKLYRSKTSKGSFTEGKISREKTKTPMVSQKALPIMAKMAKLLEKELDVETIDFDKFCIMVYNKYKKYPTTENGLKKVLNELTEEEKLELMET